MAYTHAHARKYLTSNINDLIPGWHFTRTIFILLFICSCSVGRPANGSVREMEIEHGFKCYLFRIVERTYFSRLRRVCAATMKISLSAEQWKKSPQKQRSGATNIEIFPIPLDSGAYCFIAKPKMKRDIVVCGSMLLARTLIPRKWIRRTFSIIIGLPYEWWGTLWNIWFSAIACFEVKRLDNLTNCE